MYFQIENTPEHIRRARKSKTVKEKSFEEIPRLVLAPFSRPPQLVFENVPIGGAAERSLELFNPDKHTQQITLGKALPPGLVIPLPGEWLVLDPETCYCLTLRWSPVQPTALRETIRFTNESRGRFDVNVVLKTAVNTKGKSNQPKFKTSPGKGKKKFKKSPVAVYKKKHEVIYNTTNVKVTDVVKTSVQHKFYSSSNKENMSSVMNDYSIESRSERCPFGSPNSIDFNFDTNEVFSNVKSVREEFLQETFNKNTTNNIENVLKPTNKVNTSDVFENLTFTPLKSIPAKDRLEKGPKIVISANSESDFDDSLDLQSGNKENATHSVVCITASQADTKWFSLQTQRQEPALETPQFPTKKVPETSSPKDFHSPNFSINTDFSRISDLSFLPQRFSTERKALPRANNETHDILDDHNSRLNSDTFTKCSPQNYQSLDYHINQGYMEARPMTHYQQPKVCRQSLFREYQAHRDAAAAEKHYLVPKVPHYESNAWHAELRADSRSPPPPPPPRSLTPPLQSIPEESAHLSDTHLWDKPDKQSTFTINRTFDKIERPSLSGPGRQSWSKKAPRAEPELWKVPVAAAKKSTKSKATNRDSISGKVSNATFDGSRSMLSIANHIGNVYSQSLTLDPFLSSTYFYDEEAVDKFETEFKRWLNYILTPPADLDSNTEIKIDVGKAWLENRTKEIPLAPTREQVCSQYHDSKRLGRLRRAARALLAQPEIALVLQKLTAQIEKKLIAVRADRNLHLDVGLQKAIMELLLSYNPLWLRIGLEAIYGLVLPLKSNSDIDGLTTFIIQRMFKNPHLKNKHSKASAPNMLLPAYMEAIKKFTLKKFFMLVFFLDQAKQRKLISHDPCLFCRNAVCKESREIVIRFTREMIAGIGDITRHLRPLGYVVSHKQSYLDEYKYAVHNIAIDIRDGVRLTKVMEMILIKNSLMNQLRTPAISRLQKIHNVSVALNALKEANFTIVGDITPNDIADGHREKTLSLLWQIIHVFRAPLFDKAANVIQIWWRKKYEVIAAKRREEQRILEQRNRAAGVIQCWWRKIQYNRYVEAKMKEYLHATVVVQRYWRMWLCRSRFRKLKKSVITIEEWYRSLKLKREAKQTLEILRAERQELLRKSATKIQTHVRRWLCIRHYEATIKKIIIVQSLVRCFVLRQQYLKLKEAVINMQRRYRGKLLMMEEMKKLAERRQSAIKIQSYYRMVVQIRLFNKLKNSVKTVEEKYKAIVQMRQQRESYLKLKHATVTLQSLVRGKILRVQYLKQRNSIVQLQRRIRANQLMKLERGNYLKTIQAVKTLQAHFRAYLAMKKERARYTSQRTSAIAIQKFFRGHLRTKALRHEYLCICNAVVIFQRRYKALIAMRKQRVEYMKLKHAAIVLQTRFRAQRSMKKSKAEYNKLRAACISTQRRYRARISMRRTRHKYLILKSSAMIIQRSYRAYLEGKRQRLAYLKTKNAAIDIQKWYRSCKKTQHVKNQYYHARQAVVNIQQRFRAYVVGKKQRQEYIQVRTATICIQKHYRLYTEMKIVRQHFVQLKTSTVTIQRHYRATVEARKQKAQYTKIRNATLTIQSYYRLYRETKTIRQKYIELKTSTVSIQRYYRSIISMRQERKLYLNLKQAAVSFQQRYRALTAMRAQRKAYLKIRSAVLTIQTRLRAQNAMLQEKSKYQKLLAVTTKIQQYYRARLIGREVRSQYLRLKQAAMIFQSKYRAKLAMKKAKLEYLRLRSAAITIQTRFRARLAMMAQRTEYMQMQKSCCIIQRRYRAYLEGTKQRTQYIELKSAVTLIQQRYRLLRATRLIRTQYLVIRKSVLLIQRRFRANQVAREIRRNEAAKIIQLWYKSVQLRDQCRNYFLTFKKRIILIQSTFRMYLARKTYLRTRNAAVSIQSYYRAYRLGLAERTKYRQLKTSVIKIQSYVRRLVQRRKYLRLLQSVRVAQTAYRLKRQRKLEKERRENAAICIQKHFRRYYEESRYKSYRRHVVVVQRIWRSILVARMYRCEYLQTRGMVVRLQARLRGCLIRRRVQQQRKQMEKIREEKRIHHAASKIQALFRGHRARTQLAGDRRVVALRRRWREGALRSTQQSLRERNAEAMEVLSNYCDIETVIRAFRSLELLTEVVPMMFNSNAAAVVRSVHIYMSATNRSISSIEVLKCAAATLANLTRYRLTGPVIYNRERISPIVKFMWRFSTSETPLFCILCTHLWLFHKYDAAREDLKEYLHIPENHKMMVTIKGNVDRMRRMAGNAAKSRFSTPAKVCMNASICGSNTVMPALEPDYGIKRANRPPYFEDASHAIGSLFRTYSL